MKRIFTIIAGLVIIGASYFTGYYCSQYRMVNHVSQVEQIDIERALEYLRGMRFTHEWAKQEMLKGGLSQDNPSLGDIEWQERCIKQYDQLIEFVVRQK